MASKYGNRFAIPGFSVTSRIIDDNKYRPYKVAVRQGVKTDTVRMIMDGIGIRKSMVAELTEAEVKKIERRIKKLKEEEENAKQATF